MRVCVFSPDVEPLVASGWQSALEATIGTDHDITLLTNSWAERPAGGDIHATGATRRAPMRWARKVMRSGTSPLLTPFRAAAAASFLGSVAVELLEGLRATDPDLIVSLDRGWTRLLEARIRAAGEPWPCVSLGDDPPVLTRSWRRYDRSSKVSIVLPTYNGVRYLAESISSCLSQTHAALELIVVDDGSTAPVREVVEQFDDPRLLYVRHPTNRGLPQALNTGFSRVTGDWCTWTSDDNYYSPDAIERLLSFMQTYRSVDFVYAESFRCNEQAERRPWEGRIIRTQPPESLATDNFIGACFLYTRKVAEAVGDYSPRAVLAEDYEYWVRVHQRFSMQRLLVPLYTYRFHAASLTSKHSPEVIARTVQQIKQAHGVGART